MQCINEYFANRTENEFGLLILKMRSLNLVTVYFVKHSSLCHGGVRYFTEAYLYTSVHFFQSIGFKGAINIDEEMANNHRNRSQAAQFKLQNAYWYFFFFFFVFWGGSFEESVISIDYNLGCSAMDGYNKASTVGAT